MLRRRQGRAVMRWKATAAAPQARSGTTQTGGIGIGLVRPACWSSVAQALRQQARPDQLHMMAWIDNAMWDPAGATLAGDGVWGH
ncbi:MAG: hypothetical protein ACOYB3_13765 [Azonexus sp.]